MREQALSLLHALPRHSPVRYKLVWLLGIFGSPALCPLFKELLLNPREDPSVRSLALSQGLRHGLHLSGQELSGLLDQAIAQESRPGVEQRFLPFLKSLLPLARTEDALSTARTALLEIPPLGRAELLGGLLDRTDSTGAPRLMDWLYTRWCQADRQLIWADELGRELNLEIALATRERPESAEYLAGCAPELTPKQLERCLAKGLPRTTLAQWLASHPKPLSQAAECLLLPLPELLERFGRDGLLRRLHRVVLAESLPRGSYSSAWALLGEWPEARPLLLQLLCDLRLDSGLRSSLLDVLLERERAVAVRWALAAMAWPENASLVGWVLSLTSQAPQPADRPLFLAALHGSDVGAQDDAIRGLVSLGEAGAGWCDRLTSLLQSPSPKVRLRAAAALALQGVPEGVSLLEKGALDASNSMLRSFAVHWLGVVDVEASRRVVEQWIAEGWLWREESPLPAEQAFWALSEIGTPKALTVMLWVLLRRDVLCNDVEEHLERHLMQQEQSAPEDG
jgi:hypothetical protein